MTAIEKELKCHIDNGTFLETELPKDRRALTARWVFKKKIGQDGTVSQYKARLVARGFQQQEGIDYDEIYSAVAKPASFRVLFALAALLGWKVHQSDVATAFLNGMLDLDIFIKSPPVSRSDVICTRRVNTL